MNDNTSADIILKPGHSAFNLFLIFLRLGLSSFGGPVAHISYFRDEFVTRKKWFSDQAYAEIVSLCQFLPGPASSQAGIVIGLSTAGYRGAFAAWLGFTLPSALAITLFALGLNAFNSEQLSGVIYGLKIVAVAIIFQAILGMAKSLCPDIKRKTLMVLAALIVILTSSTTGQVVAIIICGLCGMTMLKMDSRTKTEILPVQTSKKAGIIFLSLFFILLAVLPLLAWLYPSPVTISFASFYRAGSLVFGGGHVVLPLLQAEVVSTGYVSNETFLAGYGAAQAVPGPLFTFASFLGATIHDGSLGWYGSLICLLAIFLPAFLLIAGVLPFWQSLRHNTYMQKILAGANAGVVGLLIAVLYNPIWNSAVQSTNDILLIITAFFVLVILKWQSWLVAISFSVLGLFLSL